MANSKMKKNLLNLCLVVSFMFSQGIPKAYAFDPGDTREVEGEDVQETVNMLEDIKEALESSSMDDMSKGRIFEIIESIPRYYDMYYTKESVAQMNTVLTGLLEEVKNPSTTVDDAYINAIEEAVQKGKDALQYQKGTVPQIYITTADGKGNELEKWEKDENGKNVEVGYKDNTGIAIVPGEDDNTNQLLEEPQGKIKVRGNTTAFGKKKPYNFKLSTEESVLGMKSSKTWVLLANHFDPTLLRNYLVFEFGKHLGLEYTPKQQQVEVWMDGVLKGTYTLMEKIDSIVELNTEANDFMVELEAKGEPEDDVTYIITSKNVRFAISEPEAPTDEQLVNIEAALTGIETALDSKDYSKVQEKIDTESFAKYYVLNEYWKTLDIKESSVYFYYKDGKIHAGPIWDYDLSTGNTNTTFSEYWANGDSIEGLYAADSTWFPYLMKYEEFYEEVMNLFGEQKNFMQRIYYRGGLIDQTLNQYQDILKRNFTSVEKGGAGWDERYSGDNYVDYMYHPVKSYDENVEYLRDWLYKRYTWMDSELDALLKDKIEYKEGETPTEIHMDEVTLSDNRYVYDGNAKEPTVSVQKDGKDLEEGVDYGVVYTDNTNAGTATVTITGMNQYTGKVVKNFTIEKADQIFSAEVGKESIKVNEKTDIVVKGEQGTVRYELSDPNVASVDENGTVTGLVVGETMITVIADETDNYKEGRQTIKMTVTPADPVDLADCTFTFDTEEYVYDGNEKMPTVTVRYGDIVLKKDVDYTLSYTDNINAGEATITITGTKDYTGTLTGTFTIQKAKQPITVTADKMSIKIKDSAQLTLTGAEGDVTYTSSDENIATVDGNGKVIGVAKGKVIITITAAESANYKEATQTITIVIVEQGAQDITGSTVTLDVEEYVYDGEEKMPTVTVQYGDTLLVEGVDYELIYTNHVNAGEASVSINGIGNYVGTIDKSFKIVKASSSISISNDLNKVYDGESVLNPEVTITGSNGAISYEWYTMDGVMLENAPVDAGSYKVKVILEEDMNYEGTTVESKFTISVAPSSISMKDEELDKLNKVYDGQPVQIPNITQIGSQNIPTFEWYVKKESGVREVEWVLLSEAPSEVGNYKLVITVQEDANYAGVEKEVEFRIFENPILEDQETTESENTSNQISGIETGDKTQVGLWMMIIGISAAILAFFIIKKYGKSDENM